MCHHPQDYEDYRNTVGVLHSTWEEAASELDQCRLSQRRAQEEERRREAEARAYERGGFYHGSSRGGGGAGGRRVPFGERDYQSGSDNDDDVDYDADPFNFFSSERFWRVLVCCLAWIYQSVHEDRICMHIQRTARQGQG